MALLNVVVPFTSVLVIWEVVAIVYLLLFGRFRDRATRGAPPGTRALSGKLLELLSWALPVAASGTGATSATALLTTGGSSGRDGPNDLVVGALGSAGIVIAWLLLQTGFAEIYESVYERLPEPAMLSFPRVEEKPILSDFLYLSFTVGTSFAVSGATIGSRRLRRVILLHIVTSFFHNALLIAIAIQVLQRVIASA